MATNVQILPHQYRKKPVVIQAIQWDGASPTVREIVKELCPADRKVYVDGADLLIDTLEGQMRARPGDWIIKGVQGELYPCKPDIFEQTYEKV